ncbi:MAG TPA: polysaccharide deacetylase family protein [Solirubrobacteraceae bacterium]|nr:polysaccharide deacetylase family protein [Solirubrobacteraceae bacterium]
MEAGKSAKTLSLTFDDGPEPGWTERVLEELERCRVRATFFLTGDRSRRHWRVLSALVCSGHELQLHCHRHVRHTELTAAQLARDTEQALETLAEAGVTPRLWRTPWGVRTEGSERVAQAFGLRLVGWSMDTHDWRGDPAGQMLDRIRPRLGEGGAILMHDGLGPGARREGCGNTVELIAPLSAAARDLGLAIEPLTAGALAG